MSPADTTTLFEPMSQSTTVRVRPWTAWAEVAADWERLFASLTTPTPFVSALWVGTWLEVFGSDINPSFLTLEAGGITVAACLISRSQRRRLRVPLRTVTINASGESAADTVYSEYNTLLCKPGYEQRFVSAIRDYLRDLGWDELALDAFIPDGTYRALRDTFMTDHSRETEREAYYVDLASIRHMGSDYESALRPKYRKHLRQTIRYCAEAGPIRLEAASDIEQALNMLNELSRLNQVRWNERSAFSSPKFLAFHRKYLEQAIPDNGASLVRVCAGTNTVGVIYNLVHSGRVAYYQCGFQYSSDSRQSPGTVTLAHAVAYYLAGGYDEYDFLTGHGNYKRALSTGSRPLVWTSLRRRTPRSHIVAGLERLFARSDGELH